MTERRTQNDLEFANGEMVAFADPTPEEMRAAQERTAAHVRLLWERRRFLLRWTVIGLVLSLGVAFLIPSRYVATTQLMPPDNQSGGGAAALLAATGRSGSGLAGLAGDLLGTKNSGALFVGILSSRTVQDRLIEQFDLRKEYGDSKMEDARLDLAKHTGVSEDRKSGIISVSVWDHSPQRSADLAAAYVKELDRLVAEVSTSAARRERIFLEERLQAVKQDLDASAMKFSEFASKNTAIDIPAQGKAMVEAAATLQGQLIAAESELHGLEAIYTDQNVRVKALKARVSELRTQLGKLGGESGSAGALSPKSDPSLYPSIRQLPVLGVTYADLYRRTKIQETVFELLTQQYELAKVQEAKEIPSVKVLDSAVVPTKKSFPPRGAFTAFGGALFFLAACVWIFANRTYASIDPQDPRKLLAEEVRLTLKARSVTATAGAAVMLKGIVARGSAEGAAEASNGDGVGAPDKSANRAGPEDHLSQAARSGTR
ncbi:MAG TPA: Wzz/FepE/Etk N-terminal domain-containing protein [Candidatus Baltobacteraceae bacterium]|nr:Wzz/FepE/Etk N-terminal domain-containing protein [Candidatus Baltobacteraceae bacterium]